MADSSQFNHPRLVAVWPGMGNVALNAGVYLLAKLDMSVLAELDAGDLFDVDQVEVKDGIVQPGRRPRNRFFLWKDPRRAHDLVLFIGEAQPPCGKYPFCRQLIAYAKKIGVERVFTFAAMATRMHPQNRSRVFCAATDRESLEELKRLELEVLEDGNVGGLNGVLLGAANEDGLRGYCMLGEMPHVFAQLPFPKASLAILEAFTTMTGMDVDFTELAEQARSVEHQLGELLTRHKEEYGDKFPGADQEATVEGEEEPATAPADRRRIETLFEEARLQRSKAFELKQELDRLGLFKEYEDRFLDLFKKPD
jgi:proteasome assembly chaperone (PAC2) family protein